MVNHRQLKQTACPCPTDRSETIGSLTGAMSLIFREALRSALETNPQTLQENRD